MEIQQLGPATSEEFLPRYTAQDNSPPPVYNIDDNNAVAAEATNDNSNLPQPSAQHQAPKPPPTAHLARCSRIAVFAQMVLHHSAREDRLPSYESVDSLDRLSQRPMPAPRRKGSLWRRYRTAIILYSIVAVLCVIGVSLLAIYSNSLEAGEGTREEETMASSAEVGTFGNS